MKLYFATQNAHKIQEIKTKIQKINQDILIVGIRQLGQTEDLPEDFETLEDNARQKAQFIHNKFGVNCFADDTGLEVQSLHGAPGVYSARYAGEQKNNLDNIHLLLSNLKNVANRKAQFRTVIALILENKYYQFEGIVTGSITNQKTGNQGFGYDSVFKPDGYQQTFAEMSINQKNKISHRAKAVDQLITFLKK